MFKNPLRKYQQGGAAPSQEQQEMLNAFVQWLPTRVEQFKDMTPDQIVETLNGLSKTPEGQKQVQTLMEQFQAELAGGQKFKEGGKIHQFLCKHAKGGHVAGCGCGGNVVKGQNAIPGGMPVVDRYRAYQRTWKNNSDGSTSSEQIAVDPFGQAIKRVITDRSHMTNREGLPVRDTVRLGGYYDAEGFMPDGDIIYDRLVDRIFDRKKKVVKNENPAGPITARKQRPIYKYRVTDIDDIGSYSSVEDLPEQELHRLIKYAPSGRDTVIYSGGLAFRSPYEKNHTAVFITPSKEAWKGVNGVFDSARDAQLNVFENGGSITSDSKKKRTSILTAAGGTTLSSKYSNDEVSDLDEYTISSIIERFKQLPQSTSSFGHKTTYKYGDTASSGDRYYDVIESRHNGISNAMRQRGFKEHEIQRLAPFLTVQTILEGGYRLNRPDNNFGGMLIPHTYDKMQFKSPEEFYLAYIDNLDNN